MSAPTAPPADLAALTALVVAQEATRTAAEAQATALAAAAAGAFAQWYDTGAITDWSGRLAGQIESLLRITARSTDAYLARLIGMLTGKTSRPLGAIDVTQLRNGVTHAGALARAADVFRYQQARQDAAARALLTAPTPRVPDLQAPLSAAVDRVRQVTQTDVQLATRAQTTRAFTAAGEQGLITGYRRIIHPELARTGTCGLCVAAADRLYKVGELLPLHDGCHCTVAPVTAASDPGMQLNQLDFKRLYKAAGGTGRAGLQRTRYTIVEHGELGPQLVAADAKPRTARQAQAATNKAKGPKTPQQRAAAIRAAHGRLAPALGRVDELARQDPGPWGEYRDGLAARVADLDQQATAA